MTTEPKGLPEGYIPYDGSGCPVDPEQFVDAIIRTSEGLGHSGVMRARLHHWEHPDGELGNVVGYRPTQNGEVIDIRSRWPE